MEEFNTLKHNLVPEHSKLRDEERKKILKDYNISLSQLPKIFLSDPAIKHLDVKIGDVVKIIRNSPTIGESLFYRVVVSG